MAKINLSLLLFFLLTATLSTSVYAQANSEFQIANHLLQQQNYNEARPILEELHEEHPQNYAYADKFTECLIHLKEYDRGISVVKKFTGTHNRSHDANILLGELYHYKGEVQKALEIWTENLEKHPNQLQLYVNTARTMVNRREYTEAVKVYKQARSQFQNNRLFFGDIASAYMQAGKYEPAIEEWLKLLETSPNQISYIQRSLLRYNDPLLYDITITEIDERLNNLSTSNEEYETFYKLQIWLLQENELFHRALSTAKAYENRTSSFNYSLFNLGRQLTDNNEFELAEEAFSYYTEKTYGEVKWRSLEELANTYSKWAKYLDDYNLSYTSKKDSLYKKAITMLDSIEDETNNYSRMSRVYIKQAEISLDNVFDLEQAEQALDKLEGLSNMQNSSELPYLKGRIHLAKQEYARSRVAFTRGNKKAEIGEMAEKTRYFLALTDFYAGDYEFATIQLKSLGRQNTSFYANDALELRLWLQQGLAEDSTGGSLSRFAEAVFKYNNGQPGESTELFREMIEDPTFIALKDDAILFYVNIQKEELEQKLAQLSRFLANNTSSPVKEKLLWKQATLAEQKDLLINPENCNTTEDCFLSEETSGAAVNAQDIYEKLILQFPEGFYAPYARERLTDLTNENS